MTKKKTTAKAAAAKADKKNVTPEEVKGTPEVTGNDPKAEEVKDSVDKSNANASAETPNEAQDASESNSDANVPAQENNVSTATESADKPKRGKGKGSGGFQVYPSAEGEPEEISNEEVQARDQKQSEDYNKLKAVAYNRYRDTKFTKLPKRLRIDELTDLEKLPVEVSIDSEILMDNGQIYTLKDQLTQKFNKDALISI